jgi:hypothetical protein
MPSLACALGDRHALFVQQLHYWLQHSKHRDNNGVFWVYNTYEEWHQQFNFWNAKTLQRIIRSLEERGIVKSRKPDASQGRHRKWYTIDYEVLKRIVDEKDKMSSSKRTKCPHPEKDKMSSSRIGQNVLILTETTTETTPETSEAPSELASPIHAPCSAEEHTQAEQVQNNLELHEILDPQDVSGLSEDKQEPQTNTNSQPLVVSEREKAIVRRAAKIDQPSGEHLTADIDAKGTQQPRTARNTSDQYLGIGDAETGPQKPAQQADTPETPAQHTFLPESDLERSADPPKKPRRTRPASPATQYRKAVNRTLAELGFKVGNQGNPQEAITEAMELVGEDDLKPMLVWATQGWRSEWYRLEKIAEHAIAWKAREAQRKRTEIPRVEDMDLSMYDMTEEDYAAMRRAAVERQRQREEEKKNWWNTPASPPA